MDVQQSFRLRWPHYLLAVLVYLVLLLAWAPASLLAWALPRFTQQAVMLEQSQGTVWHGSAAGLRVQAAGKPQQLGRVDWRLRPLDLLSGRLGYRLQLAGAGIDAKATLRAGLQGAELREVRAELPASLLAQFSADLALWQPGGRLAVEAERLAVGRSGAEGEATLRWRDAVSGRVNRPLGSYRADLEGTDQGLAIRLSTEGGTLVLQGAGRWSQKGGLDFTGLARPAPASRAELDGLLSLIGPAQADGSRAIRIGR
jgi:general secretion pathway protein N